MKRLFILMCVCFALAMPVSAQDNMLFISGKVTDALTGRPLKNVTIISSGFSGDKSDSTGCFHFFVYGEIKYLQFSMTGYEEKVVKISDIRSDIPIALKP
jgi:hypothetical protein